MKPLTTAAAVTCVALAVPALAAPAAAASDTAGVRPRLLKPVAVAKVAPPESLEAPYAVSVDAESLVAAGAGGQVDFVLPSGIAWTITLDRMARVGEGQLSWTGIAGRGDYRAYGATGPGGSYARIETPEGTWGILPSGTGHDWLFDAAATELRLRPGAYGDDGLPPPPHLVGDGAGGAKADGDPSCPAVAGLPAPQATIDVLAVVTNGFRTSHGANYLTRLDFLYNAVNSYYAASNIAITLRRVGTVNVTIDETASDSTVLNAVTNGTGAFANIPALRRLAGADMVTLLRNTGSQNSISGVAWIGAYGRAAMSQYANSMVSVSGDAPVFSGTLVAHEIGHNMGNNHDRANAGANYGATSYAYGHVECGNGVVTSGSTPCPTASGFNTMQTGWGTIMAYYRPTVPRFASPSFTCSRTNGVTAACGVADVAGPAAANPGSDTVRSMNCVRTAIAAFYPDNTACADAGDGDNDGIPNCVESRVQRVNGTRDNDVFGQPLLFVMQQYRDFLAREADVDGLNGWMGAIAGGATREATIGAFFNSAEFDGVVGPVVRLYYATFLRVPDYAGLTHNVGQVRAGALSLAQLAGFFAASPEFAATYGALDNTQFVTLLYNNVLGRAPDAAGLAGWVAQLEGGASRGQVLVGFSESPEYKAAKSNEVYVTMMYVGMLRRSPEPTGYNGWLSYLRGGNSPLTMIAGFYNATEYRGRFLP